MATNDNSIYTSAPFKFIVEGKAIYIHADLASRHAKPLSRMINGHMAEAQQGFAVLKEVDEATFTRFVQWAYHGYYTAADASINIAEDLKHKTPTTTISLTKSQEAYAEKTVVENGTSNSSPIVNPLMADILRTQLGSSSSQTPRKHRDRPNSTLTVHQSPSKRDTLRDSFKRTTREKFPYSVPLLLLQRAGDDYTEVFLSHARLYVFAEQYDVRDLRTMALGKLQSTLAEFTLVPARTGDIIALLRYVYANTGDSVAGVEDIRTMLMAYVEYEMDVLMKDKQFTMVMVENGGPMLWDFVSTVAKRI